MWNYQWHKWGGRRRRKCFGSVSSSTQWPLALIFATLASCHSQVTAKSQPFQQWAVAKQVALFLSRQWFTSSCRSWRISVSVTLQQSRLHPHHPHLSHHSNANIQLPQLRQHQLSTKWTASAPHTQCKCDTWPSLTCSRPAAAAASASGFNKPGENAPPFPLTHSSSLNLVASLTCSRPAVAAASASDPSRWAVTR